MSDISTVSRKRKRERVYNTSRFRFLIEMIEDNGWELKVLGGMKSIGFKDVDDMIKQLDPLDITVASISSVTLPEGLKRIGSHTFSHFSCLKRVHLPWGL